MAEMPKAGGGVGSAPERRFACGAIAVACVGVYLTWMLSLSHALSRSLPCRSDAGCDVVASSAASRVLGVPVAFLGLASFMLILGLTILYLDSGRLRFVRLATALAAASAVVNLGFSGYSVLVLKAHCWWCLGSNLAFVLATILLLLATPATDIRPNWSSDGRVVKGAALLTFFAIGFASKTTTASENRMRWNVGALVSMPRATLLEGAIELTPGPVGGEDMAIVFVDMQCDACHQLVTTVARRPRALRVLVRHYPLPSHPESKDLAALAVLAERQGKGGIFLRRALSGALEAPRDFRDLARKLGVGLDVAADLRSAAEAVERDRRLAVRLGLTSTPTVVRLRPGQAGTFVDETEFLKSFAP